MADDAFSFLLSWELMSLASWALVMAHHHDAENRQAGFVYLVMASLGTAALLLAFGLLAGPAATYAFDGDPRDARPRPASPPSCSSLSCSAPAPRQGSCRLHVWLPLAHPAAPSHVSALMSGVMTKVAVYAFLRIVFDLCGGCPGGRACWFWRSAAPARCSACCRR